jgi:FkbM family methyltransferase
MYCSLTQIEYFDPLPPCDPYSSQFGQDKALEKLGLLKLNGFFVEVGCNHPRFNSNTWYLEKYYNYTGLSIDILDYTNLYASERPRTKFINCAVDNRFSSVKCYIVSSDTGWEDQMTSLHDKTLKSGKGFDAAEVQVPAKKLADLCDSTEIDLFFVDVEGHELNVLDSCDWSKFRPRAILIENNGVHFRRSILTSRLQKYGYKLIAKIGAFDDVYVLIGSQVTSEQPKATAS